MSVHRYSRGAMAADYARSFAGILLAGLPLLLVETALAVTLLFVAILGVFLVDLIRTVQRQRTRFTVDDVGITRLGPVRRTLRWSDLQHLSLSYYATRRDGGNGWLLLKLSGDGGHYSVDSRIDGFNRIVALATAAANLNGISMSAASRKNLTSLGLGAVQYDKAGREPLGSVVR